MKILVISRLFPHPRGISGSIIIYNRIRFLAESGHDIGLLSFVRDEDRPHVRDIGPLLKEMELVDDPQGDQRLSRTAGCPFSSVPFGAAALSSVRRKTGEMIECSGYEVAIAEFSAMGQCLYRNPWLPPVRRIVSCHECWTTGCLKSIRFHGWSPRGVLKRFTFDSASRYEFNMYRNMDHILVLTPEERYRLLQHAPNLRISVVPQGVDTINFSPDPTPSREENIVFVGYYPNESNEDAVLWFIRSVWPGLKKRHPGVKFYVVGRGPTRVIRSIGRRDSRVVITGAVEDIRPYLVNSRVFICPVRIGAGFHAKLLEAMACGVPVVSTSLGAEGISSWSGDTMILADTPLQMLRSISLLLQDSRLRESMAAKARDMVVRRFSQQRGMAVLNDVLNEVVRN